MTESDDPLAAHWQTVLAQWDEPERHTAFVALAAQLDRLRDAATFYRTIAENDPRHEQAAKGLEKIVARALAQIDALPHAPSGLAGRRGVWLMPVAATILLFTVSFSLFKLTGHHQFVSPMSLGVEVLLVVAIPWHRLQR